MSHPNSISIPASSELIALCQSQVALLTEGLKAAWCGVYLTEELMDSGPKLIPIVVYPETSAIRLSGVPESEEINPKRLLAAALPGDAPEGTLEANDLREKLDETALRQGYQIVLPLMYEDCAIGLLVAGRKERQWDEKERIQIEQVARTLAIACWLDRRQEWYRQQLNAQTRLRQNQHQILDDWLHQARNPLTALRTFGKLLLKRLFPEDRNRQMAENILRESDRLQELLQQFDNYIDSLEVEIANASPNSVPQLREFVEAVVPPPAASLYLLPDRTLNVEPVAIATVLEPLLLSAEAIAQEKGLTLSRRIPPNLRPLQADSRALREVLSNLIDNALKYTPTGGRVEISAGLEREGMQGIAISDNGPGIPVRDRDRIFQRHYRGVQVQSNIPGTGLGLAIAKELIEQMEGEIELISPAEIDRAKSIRYSLFSLGGTTFVVWLPSALDSIGKPLE